MSRSYKKYPKVKQEKVDKVIWNRQLRRKLKDSELLLRGSQYKKLFPNYETWQYRWSLEDAIQDYEPSSSYPTLEDWIEYWKRCCYRK